MRLADRMALYEAPRQNTPARPTRDVELRFRTPGRGSLKETVRIPQAMPTPDLITYRGHTFVRRDDAHYFEGVVWPVIAELDGV